MIHYYLARQEDSFYRIGIDGDPVAAEAYLKEYYASVEFIGDFEDIIYSDVDNDIGPGTRRIPGGVIVTCHFVFQLRTKTTDGDYFAYLRRYHDGLKEVVAAEHKRRLSLEKKRTA